MTVSHVELARLLVDSEHGADVSAKNQGGVDSAASGVVRRSFKTLQFLVEHGANSDVSIKDNLKDGSTPPHRAFKLQVQVVMRSCGTCAVEFLVETASSESAHVNQEQGRVDSAASESPSLCNLGLSRAHDLDKHSLQSHISAAVQSTRASLCVGLELHLLHMSTRN
jgi:hypothetical protein